MIKKEEKFKKYANFIKQYWKYITYKNFDSYMWNQFFPTTFHMNDFITEEKMFSFYKWLDNDNFKILYIHIPFCKSLCKYCYTIRQATNDYKEYEKYISHLIKEIDNFRKIVWTKFKPSWIYIWWGTPNIIWEDLLEKLLYCINNNFDLSSIWDFNIDLMPYLITPKMVYILKKYNVNRVNYAVQCFNEEVLKNNNRYLTLNFDHRNMVSQIEKSWIEVNIDLMVGIEWQTIKDCINDVQKSIAMWIKHISQNYIINASRLIENNYSYTLTSVLKKYMHESVLRSHNNSEAYYYFENSRENKHNDLIWFWAWAITQIFNKVSYYEKDLNHYYNKISQWKISFKNVKVMDFRFEIIRYIWLNIQFWIDLNLFEERFWVKLLEYFEEEFEYLILKNIFNIKLNKVFPSTNELKMYIYLSIFFINDLPFIQKSFLEDNFKDKLLYNYFTLDWKMIDWDFVDYKDNI